MHNTPFRAACFAFLLAAGPVVAATPEVDSTEAALRELRQAARTERQAFLAEQAEARAQARQAEARRREAWQRQLRQPTDPASAGAQQRVAGFVTYALRKGDGSKTELQVPVLLWPSRDRPKWSVEVRQHMVDGVFMPTLALGRQGLEFEGQPLEEFQRVAPSARQSLLLRHHLEPSMQVALFEFDAGEFIPDLSPLCLYSYLECLKLQHGKAAVFAPGQKLPALANFTLAGQEVRQVSYHLQAPKQPPLAVADYLTFIKGKLIVVRFAAPPERFSQFTFLVEYFLEGLQPVGSERGYARR